MKDLVLDPRRADSQRAMLNKIQELTRLYDFVNEVPFKVPLLLEISIPFNNFHPYETTLIASVLRLEGEKVFICAIANKYPDRMKIDPSQMPISWITTWKVLEKEDLPLTMDYAQKSEAYYKLFQ